jgi:cytochrome c heme-lyase
MAGAGKCPIDHTNQGLPKQPSCPVEHHPKEKASQILEGGCPMGKEDINPKNMMPYLKQLPHPEQDFPLPTPRQTSTIPRGGANDNWVYPSPQMFYNAVKRKGGDPDEESMQTVVNVHNRVNEYCWGKIIEWEQLQGNSSPRLTRFRGRYDDLSPKARLSMLLG